MALSASEWLSCADRILADVNNNKLSSRETPRELLTQVLVCYDRVISRGDDNEKLRAYRGQGNVSHLLAMALDVPAGRDINQICNAYQKSLIGYNRSNTSDRETQPVLDSIDAFFATVPVKMRCSALIQLYNAIEKTKFQPRILNKLVESTRECTEIHIEELNVREASSMIKTYEKYRQCSASDEEDSQSLKNTFMTLQKLKKGCDLYDYRATEADADKALEAMGYFREASRSNEGVVVAEACFNIGCIYDHSRDNMEKATFNYKKALKLTGSKQTEWLSHCKERHKYCDQKIKERSTHDRDTSNTETPEIKRLKKMNTSNIPTLLAYIFTILPTKKKKVPTATLR